MNLLITGAWKTDETILDELKRMGHSVVLMNNESDSVPCDYDSVEGIICNGLFLHHPIEKFSSLSYVQLTSAGFDRIDLDYAVQHGITVNGAAGVYSIPMAEYALFSVLSFYKKNNFFYQSKINHEWNKNRDLVELSGKRVCIVGCGNVGIECAKRFSAMGCHVDGIDILQKETQFFSKIYPVDDLEKVIANVDILILCVPISDKTFHMIGKEQFELLSNGCIIVNISRGAVIDSDSLVHALKNKNIYAALDVFEEEPLSHDSALWDLENVLITPHNSFVGDGNKERLHNVIFKNLELLNENINSFTKKQNSF